MNSAFRLMTIRGIDIKLHFTFPLILLWAALQYGLLDGDLGGALFGVIAISLLFVLVTLHELGHSIAAQSFGVPVEQIILSPIGGVALLKRFPDKPLQELIIAAAGPAVNVVIAAILGVGLLSPLVELTNPSLLLRGTIQLTFASLFTYVFVYNLFLLIFNLIPAFPMDGGRIFRAVLALKLNYKSATNIAGNVGRAVAVLMGLYGLFTGNIFLAFIALFVFSGAGQEMKLANIRHELGEFRVSDAYSPNVYSISVHGDLQQAASLLMYADQAGFPVTDEDTLTGFLSRTDVVSAIRRQGSQTPVRDVMRQGVKPLSPDDSLYSAFMQMNSERIESLPVAQNGYLLGILSMNNINKFRQLRSLRPDTTATRHLFERI